MKLRGLQQQLKASKSLHAMQHLELDQARHKLAQARDEARRRADSLAAIRHQCTAILLAQQQSQAAGVRIMPEQMIRLGRQYQSASDFMVERQVAHDQAMAEQDSRESDVAGRQAAVNALNDRCLSQQRACAQERDRLESLMLEDLWLGQRFTEERRHASA